MYFKSKYMTRVAVAAASVSLLVGLFGCGWWNERNPPAGALSVNLGKYSCMYQIGKKVNSYLDGDMNAEHVRAFAGCIRTALNRFMVFTRGTIPNGYRPQDLQKFLNEHYLGPQQQLSDQFVKDIMNLKAVILGGSSDVITDGEIEKMIDLVTFVQDQAIANLPYVRLYGHLDQAANAEINHAFLEQAKTHLRISALDFAALLQANNRPYSLESLDHLLRDTQIFLNWRKLHPDSMSPGEFTNLVKAHKYVVTGQLSNVIEPSDWPKLFDSISSVYSSLINFRLLDRSPSMTYGPNLDILIGTAHDIFDLIGRTIDQIPNKMVSFKSTDLLISALGKAHLLPDGIRPESADEVYRYIVSNALLPLTQPRGTTVQGLTWTQLGELESEFNLWASSQIYISNEAQQALGFTSISSPSVLQDFKAILPSFNLERLLTQNASPNGYEIQKIIRNIPPYFRNGGKRAYIMPRDELKYYGVKYGMTDLTYMNVMHTLARLLVRGFASDRRIALLNGDWTQTGVTESEMNRFYNVVHDLGVDLKFMYPKYGSGTKSFIEAKLFTYDGDGINTPGHRKHDLLNFNQIMEYITTLWSGGEVRNVLYKQISAACARDGFPPGPKDVYGYPEIYRPCFDSHFFDNNFRAFSNLPNLQRAFMQMSPEEKRDALFNLEDIARYPCTNANFIQFSEIATIATVLHYVETIFAVYDHDQNGVLDQYEIMEAFSRFDGYIARQVEAFEHANRPYSVARLKAIFAFIIKYQRIPTSWGDKSTVLWYQGRYFNNDPDQFDHITQHEPKPCARKFLGVCVPSAAILPQMSIDREGILNVLRVLTQAGEQNHKCTAQQ